MVTSSKEEAPALTVLIGKNDLRPSQSQFVPASDGFHGARALWTGQKGAEEYWDTLKTFLSLVNKKQ